MGKAVENTEKVENRVGLPRRHCRNVLTATRDIIGDMPELPEIEHLKHTLEPALVGAIVSDVRVHRADIVRCTSNGRRREPLKHSLLFNQRISRLERHGKQLAVISESGASICIHLGMSGQCWIRSSACADNATANEHTTSHVHCRWILQTAAGERELLFRDPRRFGGLWTFSTYEQLLAERWAVLGPDALTITGGQLKRRIHQTRRMIKAVLLDQRVLAGVGNIYADEALFAAGIHPLTPACSLSNPQFNTLAGAIRKTLRQAVASGGSTLQDYRDGAGRTGNYQSFHAVYGRARQPCLRCKTKLISQPVAQRTTVYCPQCQNNRRTRQFSKAPGAR